MELKPYQQKVVQHIGDYLDLIQVYKRTDQAFNQFWEQQIGPYNPLNGEGMRPYQNNIPGAAHICVKVPTAGGKTFIACNALKKIFDAFPDNKVKTVIWLVPWSNLLDQTVNSLRSNEHPYRQKLNSLFGSRVEIYEKRDVLNATGFNPTTVQEQLSIIVMNFASLRARNKDDRKAYQENSQLFPFVDAFTDKRLLLPDVDESALINVIRSLNPVVVVDESHNAESDLSVDMLKNLNPSFILELTATPRANSNLISLVPALELKKEHMVKLPVIVYNHPDKSEVINSALHLRHRLEREAIEMQQNGGVYIRPIILFQAQSRTNEDNITFERIKDQLIRIGIPPEEIKIKTAEKDELKGIDLMSPDCPVRYIITINALKEGWDCPFAYILASLADRSSTIDVEQILGRVLRQPYVTRHLNPMLNVSYVLTASAKFQETLNRIVGALQDSGFSDKDYRTANSMSEEKVITKEQQLSSFLFPEQDSLQLVTDDEIDTSRVSYPGDVAEVPAEHATVREITEMAVLQNAQLEREVAAVDTYDQFFTELGDKVKTYTIRESHRALTRSLVLPQFFIRSNKVNPGIFSELETGWLPLNQESLLKGFRLTQEDIKIDFDHIILDLYKIDLDTTSKDFTPSIYKFDKEVADPVINYILAKPQQAQIKDVSNLLLKDIGNLYPIPDQEIRNYVERILHAFTNTEQLRDLLARRYSYAQKIRQKIRSLAEHFAENAFNDKIAIGDIEVQTGWKFPERIIPGRIAPAIQNQLYEKEGEFSNQFEQRAISELGTMENVALWHRNLGRGKGFALNGFKSDHYPDFILVTKKGVVILVETKGDHLDNQDSEAKRRLGAAWANLAGPYFRYYMVFEQRELAGAYNLQKAKEIIGKIQ